MYLSGDPEGSLGKPSSAALIWASVSAGGSHGDAATGRFPAASGLGWGTTNGRREHMSDPDIPTTNDDEREVPVDDEIELELPPATIDPEERIEREQLERDIEFDAFEQGFQG